MKKISNLLVAMALSVGFAGVLIVPAQAAASGMFQYDGRMEEGGRYGDIRSLIQRTQSDLTEAAQVSNARGDQRSRYDNAQRHLSTFDRHLMKNHYDKSELDDAVADVQKILDKNTLQAASRDALTRDISELREARARR